MIDSYDGTEKSKNKNQDNSSKTPVLDNFSRDLIKLAEEGKLDPVIGRDNEINRIAQILSRRKKNNPIILGEPGCGKTAIVEGLAKKIFEGDYDSDGNCIVWCDNCNGFEFAQLDVPTKDICIPCHRCDGNFFFSDQINDFEIVGNVAD